MEKLGTRKRGEGDEIAITTEESGKWKRKTTIYESENGKRKVTIDKEKFEL